MPEHLTDVIDRYFEADRRRDDEAVVALFTADAIVFDEGKEWEGPEGLRAWRAGPAAAFEYTATVLDGAAASDDAYLVNVRLDGNFPGGTVNLRFTFTVTADHISSLRIEP